MPYGFDVSSGFRFLSGVPIDATMGRDANNSRGGADRPYSGPGQPFARNGFRNEGFKDVNFRVSWGLEFAGSRKMMLTADFFNIFNWENIQLAGTAVTNYCAGTAPADSGLAPRPIPTSSP